MVSHVAIPPHSEVVGLQNLGSSIELRFELGEAGVAANRSRDFAERRNLSHCRLATRTAIAKLTAPTAVGSGFMDQRSVTQKRDA